jgi:drug/metabolite transporter (DMT)-like permease
VAFILLGETIDIVGWLSVLLILVGVLLMYADDLLQKRRQLVKNAGILFALLAALTVACYTVWDKMAVHHLHPFVYFYSYTFFTSLFYGGVMRMRFTLPQIQREWRRKKRTIVAVALLNTFTYILVLIALSMSKAVYVGALRQVSLVVGVFLGWKFLHEAVSIPRILGVLCILAGSMLTLVAR